MGIQQSTQEHGGLGRVHLTNAVVPYRCMKTGTDVTALACALGWGGGEVSKNAVGTTGHCEFTVPVLPL